MPNKPTTPKVIPLLTEWRTLREHLEHSDLWAAIQWRAVASTEKQKAERQTQLDVMRESLPVAAKMQDRLLAIEFTLNLWRSAYCETLNKNSL